MIERQVAGTAFLCNVAVGQGGGGRRGDLLSRAGRRPFGCPETRAQRARSRAGRRPFGCPETRAQRARGARIASWLSRASPSRNLRHGGLTTVAVCAEAWVRFRRSYTQM
jgi:hypothetical protein